MHETHLIEPVIRGICHHIEREGAKKVSLVRLKVGILSCHSEDSFRRTFQDLAKGTALEDAELSLVFFPGTRIEVVSFDVE